MAGLFERDIAATELQLHQQGDTLIKCVKEEVPFSKMVKKGPGQTNILSVWGAYFPSDGADIARAEGEDKTDGFASNVPIPLKGVVQFNRSPGWKVTDVAGMSAASYAKTLPAKIAQQKMADGDAFMQMREKLFLSAQTPLLAGDATDGKCRTAGVFKLLNPTQTGDLAVPVKCRTLSTQWWAAALSGLTETEFRNMMAVSADRINGTSKWVGLVGLSLARHMNSWAGLVSTTTGLNANRDLSDETLKNVVTSFVWPEGRVDIQTHFRLLCDMTTGAKTAYSPYSGCFLDMEMWRVAAMQAVVHKDGLNLGGGERGWWESAEVLQGLNPMNQFAVYANG
jgi:hypothetical protein